jgi:hypothetical protein
VPLEGFQFAFCGRAALVQNSEFFP